MIENDVIIACDFSSRDKTLDFFSKFVDIKPYVKIGMELFYAEGPKIVKDIKKLGHKIFLDLKLHDIPNTVKKSIANLIKLDVDMTNVHAAGGITMMQEAQNAINAANSNMRLIAVTQLTSTSTNVMHDQILINPDYDMQRTVVEYANNAKTAGLSGVVCSPLESLSIKDMCGDNFITVTPGIRFTEDASGDQVRITTPSKAKDLKSNYIVVGRSITAAKDPVLAYKKCIEDFIG